MIFILSFLDFCFFWFLWIIDDDPIVNRDFFSLPFINAFLVGLKRREHFPPSERNRNGCVLLFLYFSCFHSMRLPGIYWHIVNVCSLTKYLRSRFTFRKWFKRFLFWFSHLFFSCCRIFTVFLLFALMRRQPMCTHFTPNDTIIILK